MAEACLVGYYKTFSFPLESDYIDQDPKKRVIKDCFCENILLYIPIIGTIFAAIMLAEAIKNGRTESKEDRLKLARYSIALFPGTGIFLLFADIIGTLIKASNRGSFHSQIY